MSRLMSEIDEIPQRLGGVAAANAEALATAAARFAAAPPPAFFTIARGTSDAVALYATYRLSAALAVPVGSFPPSLASLDGFAARNSGLWTLAVSQSGRSPDLVAAQAAFAGAGGLRIALVNDTASPLAAGADLVLEQAAGPELSVAATKSFACSLAAVDCLAAALAGEEGGEERLGAAARAAAAALSAPADLSALAEATHAYVIGRGAAMAVAVEAALKLKETAGLHAEAISAAEVMHGPRAIAGEGLPVIGFAGADAAGRSVAETLAALGGQGSPTILIEASAHGEVPHSLAPVVLVSAFYGALPGLARRRGLDPDAPKALSKVTLTT